MKAIPLLLMLALPCVAQSVFSDGTAIHSGDGANKRSNAYEFKGPYVLQWSLRDLPPKRSAYPTWTPTKDNHWQQHSLSVHVHDAATGRYLYSETLSGRDNHFNIPEGGKHYLTITATDHIAWSIRAKEGRVEVTEKGPVFKASLPLPAAKAPAATPPPPATSETTATAKEPEKPAAPVPAPKPSSVPGLPDGVEPAKKATSPLPPGMTKGSKP